jgi:hypothetical protein
MRNLTPKIVLTIFFFLLTIITFVITIRLMFLDVNDNNIIVLAFFEFISFGIATLFLSYAKN